MSKTESATKEIVEVDFPKRYHVVFFNDDVTPMGFVVELLCGIFSLSREDAIKKMLEIHTTGRGVAGTYIKSIAETKLSLVREVAMKANYPLVLSLEKE